MAELPREGKAIGKVAATAMSLSGISAGDGVQASVRLQGAPDVRRHIARFVNGRTYEIDRITVVPRAPGLVESLELKTKGRAAAEALGSDALVALRQSLAKAAT